MRWRNILVICLGALGLFLALTRFKCNSSSNGELTKFEILIDWQAEPTYLGIYYAKHIGEFEKLGLDVTIEQSRGANQAVAAVAAGKYYIGTASGGATVLGYNNDADIVSLGVLYPRVPSVVYGLAMSGVQKPTDLAGKRIGIYPGSITKNEFDAFVKVNQLDPATLNVVSLSGADIPLLKQGKVDAVLHYAEMSPIVVSLDSEIMPVDGKRIFELSLADYGVKGYGLNVITSRKTFQKDEERIRKVYQAILEGYRRGCENPDEAVAAFVKEFPTQDPIYVRESWKRVCALINGNYGDQDTVGWQATIDLYRSLGLLIKPPTPKDILP